MKKTAISLAAAAALGALGLSAGGAQAIPMGAGAPLAQKQIDSNIETVKHRRHWRGHRWHRHRHHRGDGWAYGGAFLGGVLLGSALDRAYAYDDDYDYPRRYRYRMSEDHVDYCLDRYRSYDVRTNTFLGYDGYRHRCNSPYD